MKPLNKEQLLTSLEQTVERHIQYAIQEFQNMDEATLLKPSPTGGWSIAQCLAHLTSYGRYYLPYLKNGLDEQQGKPTTDTFLNSWLGNQLIRLVDPKTGRKKFKAIKRHRPTDDVSAHRVVAEFIHQQEAMLVYLRQAKSIDLGAGRIPLSMASWLHLNLGGVFQSMVAHNERHMAQAKRNV